MELAGQEAVIVGDVTLDPARKIRKLPDEATRWGRWLFPVPKDFKLFWIIEALGRRWYAKSARRKEMARAVSSSQ